MLVAVNQMTKPKEKIVFAGLTARNPSALPDWYRDLTNTTNPNVPSFIEAVESLPIAQKRRVAYYDDELDQWVEVERHAALVNPEWLGRDPDTATDPKDAAWHIPTRQYDIVNPDEAYSPLRVAIQELADGDEYFDNEAVFGQIRLYRNGGEVHMDVFVSNYTVSTSGEDVIDDLVLGVQTGYNFFGSRTLYAEIVAGDPNVKSVMRGLTNTRSRRHVKPKQSSGSTAKDVTDWWVEELDRMDTVTDTLYRVIYEARAYVVDLDNLPFTPADFYQGLGVPNHLSEKAEQRLPRGENTQTPNAWQLYTALTKSLTTDYSAKDDGGALRRMVRTANDILFRPATAHDRALSHFREELRGQQSLGGEAVTEKVREMQKSTKAQMDEYDDIRNKLKDMLDEADEQNDDTNESN